MWDKVGHIIIFIGVCILGGVLLTNVCEPEPQVITNYDTLIIREVDTLVRYDTLRIIEIDTFDIEGDTTLIPIFEYAFRESLPFRYDGEKKHLPFKLSIDGLVKRYKIESLPMKPIIARKRKMNFLIPVGAVLVVGLTIFLLARR
jgi:hypothetical protein